MSLGHVAVMPTFRAAMREASSVMGITTRESSTRVIKIKYGEEEKNVVEKGVVLSCIRDVMEMPEIIHYVI